MSKLTLIGRGFVKEVTVPDQATLADGLKAAGLSFDPSAVYRGLMGDVLTADSPLPENGAVAFAKQESNGYLQQL